MRLAWAQTSNTRTESTCRSLGAWILATPALAWRLTLLRAGVGFGLSTSISTLATNSSAESRISTKIQSFSLESKELVNPKCHQQPNTIHLGHTRKLRQKDQARFLSTCLGFPHSGEFNPNCHATAPPSTQHRIHDKLFKKHWLEDVRSNMWFI